MASLKYVLTLSTVTEVGRPAVALTSWTLVSNQGAALIGKGACPGDPHGDHARIEGRTSAKKHAQSVGLRIVDADVRVVYVRQSPPPAPSAPPTPTPGA